LPRGILSILVKQKKLSSKFLGESGSAHKHSLAS